MCFFAHSAFFLFRPRVFPRALGSVARREPARTPCASWTRAEVRDTCSGGSTWHVRSGRHFERVELSGPMQTHVHIYFLTGWKNVRRLMWYLGSWMSSISSDITYLVIEKFFPDINMPDMRPFMLYSINWRPSFPKLINYKPTHNQAYCVPYLRS